MISADEKLKCIERELKYRYRVYPRLVDNGKMSERLMKRELEVMEEIAADLRAAAESERLAV